MRELKRAGVGAKVITTVFFGGKGQRSLRIGKNDITIPDKNVEETQAAMNRCVGKKWLERESDGMFMLVKLPSFGEDMWSWLNTPLVITIIGVILTTVAAYYFLK